MRYKKNDYLTYSQLENKYALAIMENDMLASKLVDERRWNAKMSVLQSYCDFNTHQTIGVLRWYKEFVDFVFMHGEELKRKLTIDEFFVYGMRYRLITMRKRVDSFKEFKLIKIRAAK